MSTRERHVAEFFYPGSFLPETIFRTIAEPTLAAALAAAPDGDPAQGYIGAKDGWYAVKVTTATDKRFVADDGEETWVRVGQKKDVGSWIVGEKIHVDDILENDANRILRANIAGNSADGYAVLTRVGNWQIASDWTDVLSPADAEAGAR